MSDHQSFERIAHEAQTNRLEEIQWLRVWMPDWTGSVLNSRRMYLFLAILCLFLAFFQVVRQMAQRQRESTGSSVIHFSYSDGGRFAYGACYRDVGTNEAFDFIHRWPAGQGERGANSPSRAKCVEYRRSEDQAATYPVHGAHSEDVGEIAFVGNAATFGYGCPQGTEYTAKLQQILLTHGFSASVSLHNVGVPHYGHEWVYENSFRQALEMKPDQIVYLWTPADFVAHGTLVERPSRSGADGAPGGISYYTKNIMGFDEKACARPDGELAGLTAQIEKMDRQSTAAGADFTTVLFPLVTVKESMANQELCLQRIQRILKSKGIANRLIFPSSLRDNPQAYSIHPEETLPNVHAHHMIAAQLAGELNLVRDTDLKRSPSTRAIAFDPDWPHGDDTLVHGTLMASLYFFLPAVLVAGTALLLIAHLGFFAQKLGALGSGRVFVLVLILAVAFSLRAFLSPHTHLVYLDELTGLRIVKMWAAGRFSFYSVNHIHGTLLAFLPFLKVFGAQAETAFWCAATYSTLSVGLVYFVAESLTHSRNAALVSAAIMAVLPIPLKFAATMDMGGISLFFSLVAVMAVVIDTERRTSLSRLLVGMALCSLVFMRPYNFLFVLFLAAWWAWSLMPARIAVSRPCEMLRWIAVRGRKPRNAVLLFMFGITFVVFGAYLTQALSEHTASGMQSGVLSAHLIDPLGTVFRNFPVNLSFFVDGAALPTVIALLALVGLSWFNNTGGSCRMSASSAVFFGGWILLLFALHLVSLGNYSMVRHYDTVRYTIEFAPPLAIASACGFSRILTSCKNTILRALFACLSVVYIAAIPYLYSGVINADMPYPKMKTALERTVPEYPAHTLFLTKDYLVADVLNLDMGARVQLIDQEGEIPQGCGTKCIMISRDRDGAAHLPDANVRYFSQFVFADGSRITFSPSEKADIWPGSPDPGP